MRIHPRQRILDVWRSVLAASFQDGNWVWGGKDGSNSISDAEQLLCLLYPATAIPSLCIDRPDVIAADVLKTLRPLGDSVRIPRTIINVLDDYMTRHTDAQGEPVFAGGSYFRDSTHQKTNSSKRSAITDEQRALDIVDSYSMSVTLCLAALGFIKVFGPLIGQAELKTKVGNLEQAVSARLTAAMTGLLRSFVVNTVEIDEPPGRVMLRMVNQTHAPESAVLEKLRISLSRIRAMLRDDVRLGVASQEIGLDNENLLFECGWTWSIAHNAAPVDLVDKEIAKRPGIADDRPYLYFTVLALDGIVDLGSQRTRELGLLDADQRRLADALQIRYLLTQAYWSTIARFGKQLGNQDRWPLEDIPWRTSDGEESEYYSLQVSAVLVQDLINRQGTDDDLNRAVEVFAELARRGRITHRVMKEDPAVVLHVPGVPLTLKEGGSPANPGPRLYWRAADFAPLLLKRSLQAARLAANVNARDRLLLIAESTMDHLLRRRSASSGLWDDPGEVFFLSESPPPDPKASWYITSRVIEGLVDAAKTFQEPPLCSPNTIVDARDLLNEAEHLLNQEMLGVDADDESAMQAGLGQIEARLNRARRIINERPGTARALILDALRELDELAVASLDATRSA